MSLQREELQRLLFRTAFCVMACDGHIDEKEVREIKTMNKSSQYFMGLDLDEELQELLSILKDKGKFIVDEFFETISKKDLSTVQEMLVLEVAFRMVNADEKLDENEIKFIRYLRSKLNVHDRIIQDRFGFIDYLFDNDYSKDIVKKNLHDDLIHNFEIPNFNDLQINLRD
ncbi:MAG TPA: TerB family tellurite resistance protein [Bacteroidia bacterium]|nr:TerB family tellurite resistance protein [Cyclobacteriaceae bacterium]HNO71441.1 TerB family tellurite resistance protein [Bacteroidia bacterium]